MTPLNIMGVLIQVGTPYMDCGVQQSWTMRASMSVANGGTARIHAQVTLNITGSSKRKGAKFGEGSSVRADLLSIG